MKTIYRIATIDIYGNLNVIDRFEFVDENDAKQYLIDHVSKIPIYKGFDFTIVKVLVKKV